MNTPLFDKERSVLLTQPLADQEPPHLLWNYYEFPRELEYANQPNIKWPIALRAFFTLLPTINTALKHEDKPTDLPTVVLDDHNVDLLEAVKRAYPLVEDTEELLVVRGAESREVNTGIVSVYIISKTDGAQEAKTIGQWYIR